MEEGNAVSDHIHMLLSVPPKYGIAMVIGYLKGKSAVRIHRDVFTSYILSTGAQRDDAWVSLLSNNISILS